MNTTGPPTELVLGGHHDLVVARIGIQKTEGFAPCSGFDNLVDMGKREWVFWTRLVQARVINTHSPFPIFLFYKDWVCQPFGVIHLLDKSCTEELLYFIAYGGTFFAIKASQPLFNRSGPGLDIESVLGDLPGDPWHVRWCPREHVEVRAQKVDEHAFLFRVEGGPYSEGTSLGGNCDVFRIRGRLKRARCMLG